MKIDQLDEKWSKKYKKSIDCSNPKGFSQRAHCAGRKKNEDIEEGKRIPRKKGQPAGSKKHSDLYTDENPKGTIHGLKFATVKDAEASVSKIRNSGKSHAHKIQAAVAMEQRAKAAGKTSAAAVYRKYINAMKKKTKAKNESIQELKIEKPDSVNTKGIKRSEMPQIATKDYNEFIDYLKDNGAEFSKQTMPAQQLKATQGEFSDKGVMKQIRKQLAGEPRKPVIASQDNYIIDGHHRWLVAWNTKDSVDVFKVNMDADKLLALVKKFPKTTYKDIYTEELYKFDKDEPMKSTVAVRGYGTMSIDGLMQNLVQSVTELLSRMKQGTDGMRFADYELNKNKVLTTKLSSLIQALDDLQAIRKQGGARSRNIQKEMQDYQTVTIPKKNPMAPGDLADVTKYSKAGKKSYDYYQKQLDKDPNKTFTMKIPSARSLGIGENEAQQELPIDVNKILGNIQEFESKQYMTVQDADMMRRAIQSLTSGRQTVYPEAILKLLTMVTR